uniref:Uncharacterized protein n=1 Tax=Tanacetum cinerariifolium TaxID=118510 RepID=A0A6L2LMK8_TANCI|nr:hypothetical protein [Tanacetum cinerariifolium]
MFITPLHAAAPKPIDETKTTVFENATRGGQLDPQVTDAEKDVVDLSEGTRLPTPSMNVVQPLTHTKHEGTQENVVLYNAYFFYSAHNEDTSEDVAAHCFMPGWGLHDDHRIYHAHTSCLDRERELLNQLNDMETERDNWKQTASESLEEENTKLVAKLDQAEMNRRKLIRDFILKKVANSYPPPMDSLLEISPDTPPSTVDDGTKPSIKNDDNGVTQHTSPKVRLAKAATSAPFGTIT